MATVQRNVKTYGNRNFVGEVASAPSNYAPILSNEVDADFDTIYAAWNGGADTVNIKDGSITYAKLAPDAQLWRDTGTTLVPGTSFATRIVAVPGDATGGTVLLGSATAKGRMQAYSVAGASVGSATFTSNRNWLANTQDDATKPSWSVMLRQDTDVLQVQRSPAGSTTQTNLLTLDATGALTTGNNYADCRRMTTQSIPSGAGTAVIFDNIGGLGGMATQPSSIITIQQAGRYLMTANVMWAAAGGGTIRRAYIEVVTGGSTTRDLSMTDIPASATANALSATWQLAVGDTVKLLVYQDSGAAINIALQWNAQAASLSVTRIG